MKRPQLAGIGLALAVVVAGKQYIRGASAADLDWLLAPTTKLVSLVTGARFVAAPGVGYIDRDLGFAIAPVCAGLHFLLAAVLALAIGWAPRMVTWRAMAAHLAGAMAAAYAATLAINTVRIAIAIAMHAHQLGGDELHRLEGVVVYLGGLCALYARSRRLGAPTSPVRVAESRREPGAVNARVHHA